MPAPQRHPASVALAVTTAVAALLAGCDSQPDDAAAPPNGPTPTNQATPSRPTASPPSPEPDSGEATADEPDPGAPSPGDDEASPVAGPATTEASTREPDGGRLVVSDVEVGAHDSFDRVVFELAGPGEAGWLIEYEDDPRSQGRGDEVEVAGDAVLRVALRHIAYPADAPAEPYDGPERIQPERAGAVVEVLQDVLYEGYQDFFVGLDAQRPYRVQRLTDPQRVVVDIETR